MWMGHGRRRSVLRVSHGKDFRESEDRGNIAVFMGVLIVVTGVALVGVQAMEGGGQGMKDHSFKLIGAEARATKFAVETGFAGIPILVLLQPLPKRPFVLIHNR